MSLDQYLTDAQIHETVLQQYLCSRKQLQNCLAVELVCAIREYHQSMKSNNFVIAVHNGTSFITDIVESVDIYNIGNLEF